MGGIRDRVAIVGMGCTRFGERWDKDIPGLLAEACYEAYEDAGISPKDIQAAWLGNQNVTGVTQDLAKVLEVDYIPISRSENFCASGTDAFRNACYAVAAGAYDIVLVAGVEKLKDAGISGLALSPTPGSQVEAPISAPGGFALAATRYLHENKISYEDGKRTMAKIAVKNHHNGSLNPKAHFQREITEDQAINAPMISWPLGLFDCCGVSDGAAAAIICSPDVAKSIRDDYILVKGMGLAVGGHQGYAQSGYDFTHFPENLAAAEQAYQEAGIKDPRKELSLAIVHDCFTITELIIYEDLGFSSKGRASQDVDEGTFTLEGELPINTDGGLKCFGHPVGASGIRMIYEVYKQLQGKAGPRQVNNATQALTHNFGGVPGSGIGAVAVFGTRD